MSTEIVALRMGAASDHALALEQACIRYGIQTVSAKAVFLGNLHHETRGFQRFEEALSYSAKRLAEVWDRYAIDPSVRPKSARQPNARAHRMAHNPRALANDTYNGRMGNRPGTDDGWMFRGRGDPQLTGRNNYTAYSLAQYGDDRVVRNPDMLLSLPDRSLSAGWFWQVNGCGPYGNRGDVLSVARIWNIGSATSTATPHGMADRYAQTERALALFADLARAAR